MMQLQLCLLPHAIAELFAQATYSGKVTLADQYGLLAAIVDESLSEEERFSIDRLLRSAAKGSLVVVDDLSAVHPQRFL
jgi:hypothetical protein